MKRISCIAVLALIATPTLALDCSGGQRTFIHAGGETCIPDRAKRVIGLHDQTITLALLELGAPVVGSMGRVNKEGETYMRSVDLLMGLDFENSGISYAGTWDAMDFEAMVAMQPDLIIGREYDMEARAKYEAIAPTVFISNDPKEPMDFARGVADASGQLDSYEAMLNIYEANIDRAKFAFPQADGATYAKIQSNGAKLTIYAGYGGLTKVLHDLGFQRTEFAQKMSDRGVAWGEKVSVELLPQMQADYIFDTYSIAYGDTFASASEDLTAILPGWCDLLEACKSGNYIVLPREISTGYSFTQLNTLVHLITTNAARDNLVTD